MEQESSREIILGRPAMGKRPLPAGASAEEHAVLLKRAVREIERREAGEASSSVDYVVFLDEAAMLARFTDDNQLKNLVAAVRRRGPAQRVAIWP
ncbi:hypothetical protein ACFZDG_35705 [Kitasatospora xanthocidica]|uniref:hypothetical protein n=1 Tax=Kitasatospora xanthocidica TaxID=83382 RepID=UPI0036EF6159